MSTQFPSAIDTNITLPQVIDLVSPIMARDHNNLQGAILAIEGELGVNPSGVFSTVADRIADIELGGGGTESPLTTKGDLYTYDTTEARLAIGTTGYVLTADSTETTGLKWAPAATSGANAALSNLASVAVNASLIPSIDDGYSVGNGSFRWRDGYFVRGLGIGTSVLNAALDVRGAAIFNEDGGNFDFRIEGDTDPNLFFIDASADKIGIGTNAPVELLSLEKNQNAQTGISVLNTTSGTASQASIYFGHEFSGGNYGYFTHWSPSWTTAGVYVANRTGVIGGDTAGIAIVASEASAPIVFASGGSTNEKARFVSSGEFLVGTATNTAAYITQLERNHNSYTRLHLRNTTNGTGADSGIDIHSGGTGASILVNSPTRTYGASTELLTADALVLYAESNASGGISLVTEASAPIVFGTGGIAAANEKVRFGTVEAVVNDTGSNYDFRVESDGYTHMIFVDASADAIGLNNDSPTSILDITGALTFGNYASAVAPANKGRIRYITSEQRLQFSENGGEYSEFLGTSGEALLWYQVFS